MARVVSNLRVLDLDDVSAKITENHRCKWARYVPREIENLDSLQEALTQRRAIFAIAQLVPPDCPATASQPLGDCSHPR